MKDRKGRETEDVQRVPTLYSEISQATTSRIENDEKRNEEEERRKKNEERRRMKSGETDKRSSKTEIKNDRKISLEQHSGDVSKQTE